MKRLLLFLSLCFICTAAIAHTINWYVDGSVYHTTTCESGENVTPPTAPEKYGYTFRGWQSYTPIEYLEGINNVQYIDTGIVPDCYMTLYIKFSRVSENSTNYVPMGARNTKSGQDGVTIFFNEVTGIATDWFNRTDELRWRPGIMPKINTIYEFQVSKSLMKIFENSMFIAEHQFVPTVTTSRTIYLNSINNAGSVYETSGDIGRIYRFKIEGIIDLIPVLDKDGTPCMYDLVEHKFYYNAGTGDFIAGPIVGK